MPSCRLRVACHPCPNDRQDLDSINRFCEYNRLPSWLGRELRRYVHNTREIHEQRNRAAIYSKLSPLLVCKVRHDRVPVAVLHTSRHQPQPATSKPILLYALTAVVPATLCVVVPRNEQVTKLLNRSLVDSGFVQRGLTQACSRSPRATRTHPHQAHPPTTHTRHTHAHPPTTHACRMPSTPPHLHTSTPHHLHIWPRAALDARRRAVRRRDRHGVDDRRLLARRPYAACDPSTGIGEIGSPTAFTRPHSIHVQRPSHHRRTHHHTTPHAQGRRRARCTSSPKASPCTKPSRTRRTSSASATRGRHAEDEAHWP